MKKLLIFILTFVFLGTVALAAVQDQPVSFDATRAQIYQNGGRALTPPSEAAPTAILAKFLRQQGLNPATVGSLYKVAQYRSPVTGLTHLMMEQQIAGLRVEGAYVKAALNASGELVHVIQNVALVTAPGLGTPGVNERQALRAALARLYPGLKDDPSAVGRDANATVFARTPFFHDGPRVERVAVLMESGTLQAGFLVETWKERGNLLHETLVDGAGQVLTVVLRTNNDSYKIFAIDPGVSAQTTVLGPGAGNAQSPAGWLFAGDQNSVSIAGNNAHAYLDTDNNNAPDAGGTTVADGNFLTDAVLTETPSTETNKNVAVQNLFYLNNVLHDRLYTYGFVEGAGNFQEDNFGLGGRGGDSVNAEAQDGGGTDNANFATPRDGRNPRMQMYLWTGRGTYQVVVNATIYAAVVADFGPKPDATGLTGNVTLVNDGTGTPSDACEALPAGSLSGAIALIDRGSCTFVTKARNAQNAGAAAVVIVNNATGPAVGMADDGTGSDIIIATVMVSQADGAIIKALSQPVGTVKLAVPPPLQLDGDLDSDIVYHEYGHGLTWRMIGRMNGPLSGAIGEGMSDVLALLFNNTNDVVGEYAYSYSDGIRRYPYTNYPLTYKDVTGAEVHDDGEVYGAIGWRLRNNFGSGNVGTLLGYIVDGMNYTPAHPAFEDMRDGILAALVNAGAQDKQCLVWEAFAHYGVGVGAKGAAHGSKVVITESLALPPECN